MIYTLIIVQDRSDKRSQELWINMEGILRERWLWRKNILTSDQVYMGFEPLKLGGNVKHKE